MGAIPDVSFDGNPNTGVSAYDSTAYDSLSGWFTLGGTSVGTAGILAAGASTTGALEGAQDIYGGGYENYLRTSQAVRTDRAALTAPPVPGTILLLG